MTLKALFYAYVLGGLTFLPLVIAGLIFFTIYTSVPVGDVDTTKELKRKMEAESAEEAESAPPEDTPPMAETQDMPRTRKGWLTMRRTFEESSADGGYVTLVRSFLDSRSKDPKRSRPKDMWYVVLKGKVLYLYEDEEMTECEAAIELGVYDVVVYPEGLLDGELFAKRNAICLKPKAPSSGKSTPTRTGDAGSDDQAKNGNKTGDADSEGQRQSAARQDDEATMEGIFNPPPSWFIFVRSNVEMEDWYFSLIHASTQPSQTPTLAPLQAIFQPSDMGRLVSTLDEQPDVIPMRWLNALIGRIFFSYYRTHTLEAYIIGRLMKKLSKVKRPAFLTDIVVTEVSVGNKAPTLSKPMLKELTKEGDASVEVHLQYKGEVRITVEATATINLGARFKSYTVKLVLAAVLKELEGNLLIKVKRPPSNRLWYAFTQPPRMILEVEPIVSDRQITWGMILSTIESRLKEIIQESVVMPNMDDIAFFESTPYLHRGGIWSDASRHEKPPTPSPLTHSLADPILEDSQSTASAPLPTTQDVLPTPAEIPSRQAHSVDEIDAAPLFASPETPVNVPAGTPPSQEDSPSSTRANRRRTWFSSVKSEDMTSLIGLDVDGNRLSGDSERGRSAEPEKTSVPRSKSTPGAADSARGEYFAEPEEPSVDRLSPHLARSPSSQHSQRRRSDAQASVPDSPVTQPTEPAASPSSTSLSPSSGSSFLSTLKSRAGDKQALSNTAKEAMRKWGVNWGNLRKDVSSSSAASDELPDDVSTGSRMRTDSTLAQKARASYAEVRAAVVERKGKGTSEDDERLSAPIPIPRRHSGRYSNASTSSADEAPANSPEQLLTPQKSGNLGTPGSPSLQYHGSARKLTGRRHLHKKILPTHLFMSSPRPRQ
ncbi:putative integral membrane protein conserved region-domain-containing protein [Infundibulicybe gibba]|nr:putative integral membrane protein conserved region-domain-containing protein [Infundibulicybe gibba]